MNVTISLVTIDVLEKLYIFCILQNYTLLVIEVYRKLPNSFSFLFFSFFFFLAICSNVYNAEDIYENN